MAFYFLNSHFLTRKSFLSLYLDFSSPTYMMRSFDAITRPNLQLVQLQDKYKIMVYITNARLCSHKLAFFVKIQRVVEIITVKEENEG